MIELDMTSIVTEFVENYVDLMVNGNFKNDRGRLLLSRESIFDIMRSVELDPQGTVMMLSMAGSLVANRLLEIESLSQADVANGIVALNTVLFEILASGFFMATVEIKSLLGIDQYVRSPSKRKEAPTAPNPMPEGFEPDSNPFENLDFKMDWNPDIKDH